jgi:ADP-ribose pyrophosphatase YjhB (NUDIX family)
MASALYSGRVRTRGCALVVKDGKLLLVNQHVPTRQSPVWLPPGGEVELGESAKNAAKRETLEETGLIIKPTNLVAVHEFIEPPFHAVELYFLAEITGGSLKVGIDPEHADDDQQITETALIPFDQLKDLPVVPEFLKDIDLYLQSGKEALVQHISPE